MFVKHQCIWSLVTFHSERIITFIVFVSYISFVLLVYFIFSALYLKCIFLFQYIDMFGAFA